VTGQRTATGTPHNLSAEHGIVTADTPLVPYDRPLDARRAEQLRPAVTEAIVAEWGAGGVPRELLVVAEPLYLVLLAEVLALGLRIEWIADHAGGWPRAAAVLDRWGWR
jgi:hypothetical protein